MTGRIEVSVVVPTRNRSTMLAALFAGLQQQVAPDLTFEVIVVDDGSTDRTPAALADLARSATFPVEVMRREVARGPASARNMGWRAARAPVVAFTDDDCVPQPGWLATLVRAFDGDVDVVQGRTMADPARLDRHGPFGRTLQITSERGYYETCNIAYRRSVLELLDGFDERFPAPAGEDMDLAWRARALGCRTAFAHDAVVHHAVFESDLRIWFRKARAIDGYHRAIRLHPEARRALGIRVFERPGHADAVGVLAFGSAAALRRSPVAALLALASVWRYATRTMARRRPPDRRRDWLAVIPASLALELFEFACYARASLRHRTLML